MAFRVRFAAEPWEHAGAAALRHAVFCGEQGLFAGHDRDAIDEVATPIVAVACHDEAPCVVGTVRIHRPEPGTDPATWIGSRLAVAADHRRIGTLGAALIRVAVGSAHAMGCTRFLAHVQAQNAPLFQRLHWRTLEVVDLHGRLHHHMQADLAHYPPLDDPRTGILAEARLPRIAA